MERGLTELWYRERAPLSLLAPLGALYGALMRLRHLAYRSGWLRSERAGKPVVVVGNLTVGGTGKTPLTIWLARALGAQGLRVGIVSRGYGSRGRAVRAVEPGSDWHQVGDEPLILARRSAVPTLVATDRLAAARALVARGVDLILADDGLQHLRMARDFEIVVIDGARGFGNARVLPAGPLREPLARLAEADAVIVNGAPEHGSLAATLPARTVFAMELLAEEAVPLEPPGTRRALATFRGERVHAVAGIGNPARFFAVLRAHGIEPIEHPFADHHALTAAELTFGDELPVLMTEKDAVKCTGFAAARLWYVPVAAHLSERDARELLSRVLERVRGASRGGGDT